jgi:hypothetical protein
LAFNKGIEKITLANGEKISEIPNSLYLFSFLAMLVITGILTTVFWLFYRLLYGFLLRKLKKNYEELQKIDL